jgi:hypothetical protein
VELIGGVALQDLEVFEVLAANGATVKPEVGFAAGNLRPAKSNISDWLLLGMEQRKNNLRPETDNKCNINIKQRKDNLCFLLFFYERRNERKEKKKNIYWNCKSNRRLVI